MGVFQRGEIFYTDVSERGIRLRRAIGRDRKTAEIAQKKLEVEKAEGRFLNKRKEATIRFEAFAEVFLREYSVPNRRNPPVRALSSSPHP